MLAAIIAKLLFAGAAKITNILHLRSYTGFYTQKKSKKFK